MVGSDRRLFLLAFDHRASFTRDPFGLSTALTPAEAARVSAAKGIIYEGFVLALEQGTPPNAAGILVDEAFGREVARRARVEGVLLAMPVEASGRRVFDFEYGDAFGAHIERFDPTFVKALVRYNPDDPEGNAIQTERLKRLSDWLHGHGCLFLFELLQRRDHRANGSRWRGRGLLRPRVAPGADGARDRGAAGGRGGTGRLENRGAGCPRGLRARSHAGPRRGRNRVACIVLGRGASEARVADWLRAAAPVPGFRGFAVGRTIWQEPLSSYRDGVIDRVAAAEQIAARYLWAIDVYTLAEAQKNVERSQATGTD